MSSPEFDHLHPLALGNEDEATVQVLRHGRPHQAETVNFYTSFTENFQPDICAVVYPNGNRAWLRNGSVAYATGTKQKESTLVELTTPECSQIDEVVAAIKANERIRRGLVSNFLMKRLYETGEPMQARMQFRTVTSYGHCASHDNFQVKNFDDNNGSSWAIQRFLTADAATELFLTGAGYVMPEGLRFSQKAETLRWLDHYGFSSSVFRLGDKQEDTGLRYEHRVADKNISDWVLRARFITKSLKIVALQTPLREELTDIEPANFPHNKTKLLECFSRYNEVKLDMDGNLDASKDLHEAFDFQELALVLIAEDLPKYVEIPDEYLSALQSYIEYIQDIREVAHGHNDISSLKNRTDNMAKFYKIVRSAQKDIANGKDRTLTDEIAQAHDLGYDYVSVVINGSGKVEQQDGYGFRYRDAGGFMSTIAGEAIYHAMYNPPTTTRAYVRGMLSAEGKINDIGWGGFKVNYDVEGLEHLHGKRVELPDAVLPVDGTQIDLNTYVQDHVRIT